MEVYMKKSLFLIITILFCFCLSACSSNDNENGLNNSETNTPVSTPSEVNTPGGNTTESDFSSEPVTIGAGTEWALSGLLTLPSNADGKVPAVVLVHGSGPQDMDQTIFENKPFKEIAEYLSSNGIAVIRYDKRSLTHGLKMTQQLGGSVTMWEETIEDAILAANILKADPRIDGDRVFILGHSLGGMLAPRIHASGGDFAGLILLAGTPRSMIEGIPDQQMLYVLETMEGDELEAALAMFELVDEQIAAIVNTLDDEAKVTIIEGSGGVSVYYLKDNHIHPASDFIKDITVPFLVIHAENDLQVFMKDFEMYKELLGDRPNVTFKLYEGLNHLFMPSTVTRITDLMEEYKIKANIYGQVLKDIADWINAN
jgi:hypothetical protein